MANQFYLFFGEEDFLIEEKVNALKEEIPDPSLNVEQLQGVDPNIEEIAAALQTQPLLGGEKLIIIRDLDLKQKIWDEIIPSLKAAPASIRVVFWVEASSKASKLYKFIDENGEVLEFKPFADWQQEQVISWIVRRVRSLGSEIGYQAAEKLQEICGNGLRKLSSEIDKIIAYAGDRKGIREEDVMALASPGAISEFVLSEALMEKNLGKSLTALQTLNRDRADFFRLLSLLAANYRVMLQIKSFPDPAKNPAKIAQAAGANPYFVKKCMARSQNFTTEELSRNLELLLDTDLKMKSGLAQLTVFELLLASLCSLPSGRR